MSKTLIAAATAALLSTMAGSVLAQSSVTVYGRLNVSAERQDNNGRKTSVLQNNASRLGFKGTEDLGGGMKAGFQLEHGFNADTGAQSQSAFWARQSEVWLGGGFGTLRLGNFTPESYYATSDYIGMHNHETGTSSDALYVPIAYVLPGAVRTANKVGYRTPEFVKGLTLEAAVSANENGPANVTYYDFAANYQLGALHIGVGAEKAGRQKQIAVSALFEAGAFVFGGLVQRDTDGFGIGLGNRTNYRGSMAYIFGNNELHLNIGKSGDYSRVADSDAKQWTVGYNYNLSKRTKVYGFYTKVDASRNTPYASDFSSIAAGVRHNF